VDVQASVFGGTRFICLIAVGFLARIIVLAAVEFARVLGFAVLTNAVSTLGGNHHCAVLWAVLRGLALVAVVVAAFGRGLVNTQRVVIGAAIAKGLAQLIAVAGLPLAHELTAFSFTGSGVGFAVFRTILGLFARIAGHVPTRITTRAAVLVAIDQVFTLVAVSVAATRRRRWTVTVFFAVFGILTRFALAVATFGGHPTAKAIAVCGALGDIVEHILQPTRCVVDAIVFTRFFALAIRDALNVLFAEAAVEALIAHVAVVENALEGVAGRGRRSFAVLGAVVRVFTVFAFAVSTFG